MKLSTCICRGMGANHHHDCPKYKEPPAREYVYKPDITVPRRVTCPTCKGLGTVLDDQTVRFPDVQS